MKKIEKPFLIRNTIAENRMERIRPLMGLIYEKKSILSGFRGSIAHGLTSRQEDDKMYGIDDEDTFELYCYPTPYYLSLESYYHRGEVKEHKHDIHDEVQYEIRKAIHLLSGCNPNVMTFLYNKPEHYFNISEGGKLLIKYRDIFLSRRRIYMAYSGYAYGQLKKLETGAFRGYMGEKRKKIVEEIGYDTKNAMTLVRLLRNGRELLETGTMQVFRDKDKEELLEIKKGKYSIDDIQKLADKEFHLNEEAYKQSKLPEENKRGTINELCVDLINMENTE